MSKEATGQFGTKLGSDAYWSNIHRSTILDRWLNAKTNYRSALQSLGARAAAAIEDIYDDLSKLGRQIRYLPSADRNALAKQVKGLYDICMMSNVSCRHSNECIQALNLSVMSPWSGGFRDERGIEKAISFINRSSFSGTTAMDLLREAIKWSISSAAGRDTQKQEFLEAVAQGNDSRFLQDVAEEYQHQNSSPRYEGDCGYPVGSGSYLSYMEAQVFGTALPFLNNAASGNADYERVIRENLRSIADRLERDLDNAIRENDYITDETADKLKSVVSELEHCGVSTGFLNSKIDKLAWFVGGDPHNIRKLQQSLNKLGYNLTEDGVFGTKTLDALNSFHNELARGAYPTLAWVDPLQSKLTGIEFQNISSTAGGITTNYASFLDVSSRSHNIKAGKNKGVTVFRADQHKSGPYHINTVSGSQIGKGEYVPSSAMQRSIINKLNHKTIDERTYNILKDFDAHAKKFVLLAGFLLLQAQHWTFWKLHRRSILIHMMQTKKSAKQRIPRLPALAEAGRSVRLEPRAALCLVPQSAVYSQAPARLLAVSLAAWCSASLGLIAAAS